jgi:tetratricopeptide (TPR) repeat protein
VIGAEINPEVSMLRRIHSILLVLCVAVMWGVSPTTGRSQESAVRVWEEPVTLSTWTIGAPLTTPMFYHGRGYQGARGFIYPYPAQDKLTNVRKDDVQYKMLYLENKYVKIGVLPEIGGRLFYALDKTNNYKFFYSASVVKPGLVGMLGAWLDGGIEWNVVHHHRPSIYLPVQYKLEENPDGSKTIWVGEMEINHRMRWAVGLTLHPDKSYLEGTWKLINQTPAANSFLYFANMGVPANPQYQVLFPPSIEAGTYHSKVEFVRWPIADGRYRGVDFTGQDVSWWKTQIRATSIFAHNTNDPLFGGNSEDWFGGYDHGKKAGVLYVADHHIAPGGKFWTWGAGEEGQRWDRILTVPEDGSVMELMAGSYSDNEPDYSWVQPYEVKTVKQYYYPFQQIGPVKHANLQAALNLEVNEKNVAKIGFQTTAEYRNARVLLEAGGKTLFEEGITIDPGRPFLKEVTLPGDVKEKDLKVSLYNGKEELISYKPYQRKNLPLPAPATPPPDPTQVKTNEETYLAGLRLEQFFNPSADPYPWYEEVLKRDPGDSRVNTELGILYWKRGMFKEAEERLQTAVTRVTHNYTRPRYGEPLYYLGLVLKAQDKNDAAYKAFYDATWSYAFNSSAYYGLAQLACMKGDFEGALEFLDRSISTNTLNTKSLDLKAAVLRKMGRPAEAEKMASAALAVDPLDLFAQRERNLARKEKPHQIYFAPDGWNDDLQLYLEMATSFAGAGLWEEGISVLDELVDAYPDKSRVYPMVYYWLGYLNEKAGKAEEAARSYGLANQMPSDYCFPFRVEEIDVLNHAMQNNPRDARAPYYLGNLLYDRQPEQAIKVWEKARSLDGKFAMVHRNLADAYAWTKGDYGKAVESLETAISLQPVPKFLAELDELYERAGVSPQKRLAMLEKHQPAVAERDDALSRQIRLYVELGNYDKALEMLLSGHIYTVWEGGRRYSALASYKDVRLLKGHNYMKAKKYKEALKEYEAALQYPEAFSIGRPTDGGREPLIDYFIATAYKGLGDTNKARTFLEKAAAPLSKEYDASREFTSYESEIFFYRAKAAQELGRAAEAAQIFDSLIKSGREAIQHSGGGRPDYFAKFGERESKEVREAQGHYILALGYLGSGKQQEAKAELEQAVKLNVDHLEARYQLSTLGDKGELAQAAQLK